ncbi:hypothetical protein OHB14_15985 [Streptomyces sp. NBC_01613]|uniref:hypothetical protein n=1 Tax=Streptomyces sp. NBC_01613 TaxID=2975896 RepID=UPI0038649300
MDLDLVGVLEAVDRRLRAPLASGSPFRAALTPEQQVLEGQLVAMALDTVTGS